MNFLILKKHNQFTSIYKLFKSINNLYNFKIEAANCSSSYKTIFRFRLNFNVDNEIHKNLVDLV